jgi:hypothetical protein
MSSFSPGDASTGGIGGFGTDYGERLNQLSICEWASITIRSLADGPERGRVVAGATVQAMTNSPSGQAGDLAQRRDDPAKYETYLDQLGIKYPTIR